MNLHQLVNEKFTSGNSVPVERITITRAEIDALTPDAPALTDDEALSLFTVSMAMAGMLRTCQATEEEKETLAGLFNGFSAKLLSFAVNHSGIDGQDLMRRTEESFWQFVAGKSPKH